MPKYAQIIDEKVHNVVNMEKLELQSFPPAMLFIEIKDGEDCIEGYKYNFDTRQFSKDLLEEQRIFTDTKNSRSMYIKKLASNKITSILSDIKQRNSLYTLYKHNKKAKSSQTSEEKAEIADLEAKWSQIEALREASNLIEAEINNLQTIEELQAYNIKDSPLWS